MKNYFDENKLLELASTLNKQYNNNEPFPHIVIDNFMDEILLDEVANAFPSPDKFEFYKYDNPLEKS